MTVAEIQRALLARGYDLGTADGVWGAKSKAAARAFQKANGLVADGVVGPRTLAALAPDLREVGTTSLLTAELVRKVCPGARSDIVDGILDRRAAIEAAGIVTKPRLAHFLAQIATETGGLKALEENLYYTAKRLVVVFNTRFKTVGEAAPFANNPQALANKVYGGRKDLGNTQPGDGWRYRGGGAIQTTGRANYREAGYEDDPDAIRSMPAAIDSALVFWMSRGLNAFADKGDIVAIRKRVNGGKNGLDEARTYYSRAAKALGI